MNKQMTTTVRMLALLHGYCREHDIATTQTIDVPTNGIRALDLASSIGLPVEDIEGLFLNGRLVGLGAAVRAGDRVAFLPYGTPASHPAFFGRAGIEEYAVA
jgi:molybdopterin converting factor small subunit